MNREEKLLSLPYRQRQFIHLVDGYEDVKSKKDGNFLEDTGDVVFDSLKETFHDSFNPSRIAENFQQKKWSKLSFLPPINYATNVFESIKEKSNGKDFTLDHVWENEEIKPIVLEEQSKLKFQVGHPLKNTVYVAHPVEKDTYYPFANFHRLTFEHKWAEAINLLLHLGATEIKVEHKTGWNRDFATTMTGNFSMNGVPVDSKANFESKENSTSGIISEFYLPNNKVKPHLPDNLVWYEHENTWKQIVRGRLKFSLEEFSLQLEYKEDFNVNADISAKVLKYGLGIGGKFEKHESTSWLLKGKFNSVPANKS